MACAGRTRTSSRSWRSNHVSLDRIDKVDLVWITHSRLGVTNVGKPTAHIELKGRNGRTRSGDRCGESGEANCVSAVTSYVSSLKLDRAVYDANSIQ